MSWISQNYEKAALGAGAVAAAGLLYLGWQKHGSVSTDFSAEPVGTGPSDPAVKNGDLVSTAKASLALKREWVQGDDNGRAVDLFTGVALFVNKNNPEKPVDLIKDPPVHEPIPNSWWLEHRIDPGFGDSPQRDADDDGFSNVEEFTAKTDPNNKQDYPSLIAKLSYVGDESVKWVLRPGFEDKGAFPFEYSDDLRKVNRVGAASPVAPGQIFFTDGDAAKGRFKLVGSEVRQVMNEAIQTEVPVTIVIVEDQRPNKLGTKYEIPASFRRGDAKKYTHFDRTAILTLDALGMSGQEFKVEEFTEFSLPPGSDAKKFKLTEITPDQITIEATDKDGKKVIHRFAKGATSPIGE